MKLRVYAVGIGNEFYDGNFKLTDDNHCKLFLHNEVDYIYYTLMPAGKLKATSVIPFLVTQKQYLERLTMTTYPVNSEMYWAMKDLKLVIQGMTEEMISKTMDVFNLFVQLLSKGVCKLKRNDVVNELARFNFNVIKVKPDKDYVTFVWTEEIK